jgi:hypothetical protein
MSYKIYISTTQTEDCMQHIGTIKRALFNINEFPIAIVDILDENITQRTLEEAKPLIDQSDIFIGLYGKSYGEVAAGMTQSHAEQEYHYAVSRNKTILIFMPQSAYAEADERQQMFLQHIMERHVVHQFTDDAELAAKVTLSVAAYKQAKSNQTTRVRPASEMNLNTIDTISVTTKPDEFEALINRAVSIAQDDIEKIVRRAIELHQAQVEVQQREPLKGLYVEDERDGLVLSRPIFGEPLRRSQFQSDIFMVMPFRQRFNAIYDNIIRPIVTDLNLTIKRGDDFSSIEGAIINEVWAAIYGCRLVIVETTEINANVYYELGIAHTLGKPTLLLTQTKEIDQLPFDIRHLRFIVYEDSITGGEKLEQDLRKSIVWILNDLKEQEMK